jgi:hypothetical protein
MGFYNLTNTFGLLSGNQPASLLDTNFQQLAILPLYATTVGGTANAITITVPLPLTAGYQNGMVFSFVAVYNNTSSAPTLNVNGTGPKVIVKDSNAALAVNNIVANGVYQVYYDGTNFHLANPTISGGKVQNVIINGAMNIDQRNEKTAVAITATGSYISDRFAWWFSGVGRVTGQTIADAPSLLTSQFVYSASAQVTTIDNSIAAGDYYTFQYGIEGFDSQPLINNTFTVSFYVRATLPGTYCFAIQNSGATTSYIQEYTVAVADTWQFVSLVIPSGLPSASFTSLTNSFNAYLIWTIAAGNTGTANVWTGTNAYCTTNQVNGMGTLSNIFRITGVQLYVGSSTPSWESRPFGEELQLCQRYYQKSFNIGVVPAQNAGTAGAKGLVQSVGAAVSMNGNHIQLPTTMRATPTAWTFYNTSAANAFAYNSSVAASWTSTTIVASGMSGGLVSGTTAPGSAVGQTNYVHWTADADA